MPAHRPLSTVKSTPFTAAIHTGDLRLGLSMRGAAGACLVKGSIDKTAWLKRGARRRLTAVPSAVAPTFSNFMAGYILWRVS